MIKRRPRWAQTPLVMLQFELFGMDRIPVSLGDVIGVTNDADTGPVAVSYTAGPARILRRPISRVDDAGGRGRDRKELADRMMSGRTTGPQVGKIYEFTVVPFALEFSLNADIGTILCKKVSLRYEKLNVCSTRSSATA